MKSRRRVYALGILVVLAVVLYLLRSPILYAMGALLVNAGPPEKADVAVVLAGDGKANRILLGAKLCKEGYVPKVLVSGPLANYGYSESDLAIAYVVKKGYPEQDFINFPDNALSTRDEANLIVPALRKMGVHKYLLVTSSYHTARAGRLFRSVGPDLEEHSVGAFDPDWNNGYWWKTREGKKLWLLEATKTVANYFGI